MRKVVAIDEAEIKKFASQATFKVFEKNEVFASAGDICHQLLFIQQGLFRYYYILQDGVELTKDFAIDKRNPFCTAFTSFITQKPSQIWIEALEESQVWIWENSYIAPLFNSHPDWMLFAKKMTELLFIRKEKRESSFLLLTPKERYEEFLKQYPNLDQKIPQYQIASYLGITPESLSRIRGRI